LEGTFAKFEFSNIYTKDSFVILKKNIKCKDISANSLELDAYICW